METLPSSYFADDTDQIVSAVPVEEYIHSTDNDNFIPSLAKEMKKTKKNGVNSVKNYTKKQKAALAKGEKLVKAKKNPQNDTKVSSTKTTGSKSIKSKKNPEIETLTSKSKLTLTGAEESEESSQQGSSDNESDLESRTSTDFDSVAGSEGDLSDAEVELDRAEGIMARLRSALGRKKRYRRRLRPRRSGTKRKSFKRKHKSRGYRRRKY